MARSANREVSFEQGKAKESIKILSKYPLLGYVYPDHYTKISVTEEFIFSKNYKR